MLSHSHVGIEAKQRTIHARLTVKRSFRSREESFSFGKHVLCSFHVPGFSPHKPFAISLMLFFDTLAGTNPFRNLTMIDVVEPAPVTLSKTEWNAVRRCTEQLVRRDHGLALALATLFRYAGPRVSEVAALQIPDVQISARRGLLIIRRGKGLKHREIPLSQEVR